MYTNTVHWKRLATLTKQPTVTVAWLTIKVHAMCGNLKVNTFCTGKLHSNVSSLHALTHHPLLIVNRCAAAYWCDAKDPARCATLRWCDAKGPARCAAAYWCDAQGPTRCAAVHWCDAKGSTRCSVVHRCDGKGPTRCVTVHWCDAKGPARCAAVH
jgi:hypothetical protein